MPARCPQSTLNIVDHPRYYTANESAPGNARRHVREQLGTRGLGELTDDVAMIVSELVTNAVLHGSRDAGDQVALWLELTGRNLVIKVWDGNPAPPQLRGTDAEAFAEHGNGLRLVDSLSSRWNWHPTADGGKVVWSEIDIKQETDQ